MAVMSLLLYQLRLNLGGQVCFDRCVACDVRGFMNWLREYANRGATPAEICRS